MKTICIASTSQEAEVLARAAKHSNAMTVAIAYTPQAAEAFEKNGLKSRSVQDYVKEIDFVKLDFEADKWSKTWYLKIPVETHAKIQLGELSETDLFSHHGREHNYQSLPYQGTFIGIFGAIERLLAVIKKEKPDTVMTTPTWFGTLVKETCQAHNVDVVTIACDSDFAAHFPHRSIYAKHIVRYHIAKLLKKLTKPFVAQPAGSEHKRNILLVNNYPPSFMPLFEELKKNPENNPLFLAKGLTAVRSLLNKRMPFVTFDYYESREVEKIVEKRAAELRESLEKLFAHPPDFSYKNVPFFPLLADNLVFLYLMRYPEGVLHIELSRRLLKDKKIDVIVTLSDGPHIERTLVLASKQIGCKSLCIQHGIAGDMPSFSRLYCDKMAVFGKNSADIISFFGVDKRKLIPIGQSKFDVLTQREYHKEKVSSKLGFNPAKPIILFASQTVGCGSADNPWQYDTMVRAALEGCKDKQLVVKIHPAENLEEIKRIARNVGSKVPILKKFDLQELINACDVFINKDSTTGIEAMVMKKPMIVINPGKRLYFDYSRGGGAVVAHNAAEVKAAVEKIIANRPFREKLLKKADMFLKQTLSNYRANSTQKTCEIIEELASLRAKSL